MTTRPAHGGYPDVASQPAADRGQAEVAWLIELGSSQPCEPRYWGGVHGWTQDHLLAVRFCRENDARSQAEAMSDGVPGEYRLAEHMWPAIHASPSSDAGAREAAEKLASAYADRADWNGAYNALRVALLNSPADAGERIRAALLRLLEAVRSLGDTPPGRRDTYFEAPLLSTDDGVARWQELDAAGKEARRALTPPSAIRLGEGWPPIIDTGSAEG